MEGEPAVTLQIEPLGRPQEKRVEPIADDAHVDRVDARWLFLPDGGQHRLALSPAVELPAAFGSQVGGGSAELGPGHQITSSSSGCVCHGIVFAAWPLGQGRSQTANEVQMPSADRLPAGEIDSTAMYWVGHTPRTARYRPIALASFTATARTSHLTARRNLTTHETRAVSVAAISQAQGARGQAFQPGSGSHNLIAPGVLGHGQPDVGGPDQRPELGHVAGQLGAAGGNAGPQTFSIQAGDPRGGQLGAHLFGQAPGRIPIRLVEHHQELLAAVTGDQVVRPEPSLQDRREPPQHGVAHEVPVALVECAEMIEMPSPPSSSTSIISAHSTSATGTLWATPCCGGSRRS